MIYGYARCSTTEEKQDINRQIRELKAAGAEMIFSEYEHGNSITKKEQDKLFEQLTEGDTLITCEVSRLSRSTKQLCELLDKVKERKIKLQILNSITIDCRNGHIDPMSEAFLQMAGVFAQLELSLKSERTKSGMANARAKGKQIGRPKTTEDNLPADFKRAYPIYKAGTLNKVQFSRLCGISRPTLDKYLAIMEQ